MPESDRAKTYLPRGRFLKGMLPIIGIEKEKYVEDAAKAAGIMFTVEEMEQVYLKAVFVG